MRAVFLLVTLISTATVTASTSAHRQERSPEAELAQIVDLLQVSAGKAVADVGAGGGLWTFGLARWVGASGRVYATEVKEIQVDGLLKAVKSRSLENVEVVLGSQADMGLSENCCDALLLRLVYHAFDSPDRMRNSMRRAVKPGGLVLVVDFRPPPDQLTREMQDAGFERVHFIERWQGQDGVFALLFRKSIQ